MINNVIFILFLQSGRTPLHEAASHDRNVRVVEILVTAGADGNIVDKVSFINIIVCQLINNFQEQTVLKISFVIQ